MSKKKIVYPALLLLLLMAGILVWWYFPRPLLKPGMGYTLYCAEWEVDGSCMDVTNRLDSEEVLKILSGYRCDRSGGSGDSYPVEDGRLTLWLLREGERWLYVTAYPDKALGHETDSDKIWNIRDGNQLWQELQPLLPEL